MIRSKAVWFLSAALVIAVGGGVGASIFNDSATPQQQIDFNRDIRPIFNANCMACHGGVKQASNVSFSYREQALGHGKSGRPTVVPGNPGASELITRITSKDPEVRMPLGAAPLSEKQVGLLREWIKEGAQWSDYWAFVPPKPRALPAVKGAAWVRQPLDRFILARLEKEHLAPSPEADKAELLRRVSLDLTGMPPTPDEQTAFLADTSKDAYEKQVDRLLASPRYGERWASVWLDLARYGDSKGLEKDRARTVWPYRDWVIDAYNSNMPYDQFVTKQLAGDLLPNPSISDQIATSFHRQTQANDESGTDDEEFRVDAVIDRTSTTWQALNGVSFGCVQCHTHPYDPIRHAEFYKFMAFFNTQRDADISYDPARPDDWPTLAVPKDKAQYDQAYDLQKQVRALRNQVVATSRSAEADPKQWKLLPIQQASISASLALQKVLDELKESKASEKPMSKVEVKKADAKKAAAEKVSDENAGKPRANREQQIAQLEKDLAHAKTHPLEAGFHIKDGVAQVWGTPSTRSVLQIAAPFNVQSLTALKIEVPALSADSHTPESGFIINHVDAWIVRPDGSEEKIAFRLMAPDAVDSLISDVARDERSAKKGAKKLAKGGDAAKDTGNIKLTKISLDSKVSKDTKDTKDANDAPLPVRSPDEVMQRMAANGGFLADPSLFYDRWVIAVPDAPLHLPAGAKLRLELTQTELISGATAAAPRVRLSTTSDSRWTALAHSPQMAQSFASLEQLDHDIAAIPSVQVLVMAEQADYEKRHTLEFNRGDMQAKVGPNLIPDTPAVFPKMPANAPRNRLTLAKWFFQPGQPLTSRVAVNRYWEQLFGIGIVETLEDFGSAGELPSHPELLDWMALHFQNDLHWNQKALVREIVTSATYRQSAKITPVLLEKDPRNRLLARGPEQRLSAEMVRDQGLVASGLFNPEMGGPPVMPVQPPKVWMVGVSSNKEAWIDATGPDRYRRAVYTFIKRTATYPSFVTFDMADRTAMSARRIPTNTPLQALVTLNDPVYHEMAIALAGRMMKDVKGSNATLDQRLNYGAKLVLSRDLAEDELAPLRQLYIQAAGGSQPKSLAGYTAVGTTLFNLDAALTR